MLFNLQSRLATLVLVLAAQRHLDYRIDQIGSVISDGQS